MIIHRALIWLEEIRELTPAEKRLHLGRHHDPYQTVTGTWHGRDARLLAASTPELLATRLLQIAPHLNPEFKPTPTINQP